MKERQKIDYRALRTTDGVYQNVWPELVMRMAEESIDLFRNPPFEGDVISPVQEALHRLALAVNLVLYEVIDPASAPGLSERDRARMGYDPAFQDGWDCCVDYINSRLDVLFKTVDEGAPWPRSVDSYREELRQVLVRAQLLRESDFK